MPQQLTTTPLLVESPPAAGSGLRLDLIASGDDVVRSGARYARTAEEALLLRAFRALPLAEAEPLLELLQRRAEADRPLH